MNWNISAVETDAPPAIAPELLLEISEPLRERQVIVHCCFSSPEPECLIRIWKSTYLIDRASGARSALLFADRISLYPVWTLVPDAEDYWFTLVFSGLPADCRSFDLQEIIPQEGGFRVRDIRRNKSDVYRVKIND